jgi:hypothetical protein
MGGRGGEEMIKNDGINLQYTVNLIKAVSTYPTVFLDCLN